MTYPIILDTGPLVAFIDKSDRYHQWALDIWPTLSFPLLTCEAVISEACFLLQTTHGGSDAVMGMVEDRIIQIDLQLSAEIASIRALMQRYQSVPMDFADGCLVRLSELRATSPVLTIDTDFYIYRKNRKDTIELINPDSSN
jgi:predicted nucleic acid-binding protein